MEDIAKETQAEIADEAEKVKQERIKARDKIKHDYHTELQEIKKHSTIVTKRLKAAYAKFQTEVSQDLQAHGDLENKVRKAAEDYHTKMQREGN